jgi:hypothetical protein
LRSCHRTDQIRDSYRFVSFMFSKLRATLARHQKKSLDSIAALRPRPEGSPRAEPVRASSRFQSLRALGERAVPLDQPSPLTFLTEPVDITANEVGGSYLVASSLAPTF